MQPTQQKAWRAGRFWWDWPRPGDAAVPALRAVVFDLDAIADIECAGHRPAFNKAFAELGLDISWSEARYRQLMALSDERRRVAAELRKRGISSECDVLAELLVDEICATKDMILAETILDADITARAGLVDLITEAYAAGISVGIVSSGNHAWVEPLVRQLVGEGVVAAIVTASDVPEGAAANLYRIALAELGAASHEALAFAGSPASQRAAAAAGLPTIAVGATAEAAPLRVVDCQRVRDQWRVAHPVTAA